MRPSSSISRRDLLKQSLLLAAGCASATAGETAAHLPDAPPQSAMHVGFVTYNIAKDWDLPTIIQRCAEVKMDGVELRTTHAHGVEVSLSAEARREVRRRFEASPVRLAGMGSAFDYHTPDQAKLRRDIEATKRYIQLAHDVGAPGVKVRPNGLPKEAPVEKTLEQIGRSLRELGEFGAGYHVHVRLEIHGARTAHIPYIRRIMDVADHPNVGVCWNSNQTDLDAPGFDANFDMVKNKIFAVHMRDLYLEEYPFRHLLHRLNGIGFKGFCFAEIPSSPDPLRVLRYFRGLWLAYQA